MTMRCFDCEVILDLTGKCPNCGRQCIKISGNAKITMEADNTKVEFET